MIKYFCNHNPTTLGKKCFFAGRPVARTKEEKLKLLASNINLDSKAGGKMLQRFPKRKNNAQNRPQNEIKTPIYYIVLILRLLEYKTLDLELLDCEERFL